MSPPAAHGHELAVPAHGRAMGVSGRLAPNVKRQGGVGRRPCQVDARQSLSQHPAEIDVVLGRRQPAVAHVGDVTRLPIGADRHLPKIVTIDREGVNDGPCSRIDDRDVLRASIGDQKPGPIRRERNAARLTADRETSGYLPAIEIDPDDFIGHPHGHVGGIAVGRQCDASRLGAYLDASDQRNMVVLEREHSEIVSVPVSDDRAAAVR